MSNPYKKPGAESEMKPEEHSNYGRHGCLIAYLIVMILVNAMVAASYSASRVQLQEKFPEMPDWTFPTLTLLGLVNVICAVALFNWRKWGFWGFCLSSFITVFVNIEAGLPVSQAVSGLVGIAILYLVLQIGNHNKGWPQLR